MVAIAPPTPVRAAGGVLCRDGRVVLVHRPRYQDWSLPKGKLDPGEQALAAACREVTEETGIRPVAGARLPTIRYPVRGGGSGAEKVVEYWAMTVAADTGFTPNAEIDELCWLSPEDAMARLSYPHDARVVSAFTALPAVSGLVVLVRHVTAGKRASWPGPDAARPLDQAGLVQARVLAELLPWFAPTRLISASPRRCVQSLAPLASTLDRPIEVESGFDDFADPARAAERIRALGASGGCVVVCSQGRLIPGLLAELTGAADADFGTAKGDGWTLPFAGASLVGADRLL